MDAAEVWKLDHEVWSRQVFALLRGKYTSPCFFFKSVVVAFKQSPSFWVERSLDLEVWVHEKDVLQELEDVERVVLWLRVWIDELRQIHISLAAHEGMEYFWEEYYCGMCSGVLSWKSHSELENSSAIDAFSDEQDPVPHSDAFKMRENDDPRYVIFVAHLSILGFNLVPRLHLAWNVLEKVLKGFLSQVLSCLERLSP